MFVNRLSKHVYGLRIVSDSRIKETKARARIAAKLCKNQNMIKAKKEAKKALTEVKNITEPLYPKIKIELRGTVVHIKNDSKKKHIRIDLVPLTYLHGRGLIKDTHKYLVKIVTKIASNCGTE